MLELDTRGLICPLPVLKLRKALSTIEDGASIRMIASDPATQIDVVHFCQEAGVELVSSEQLGDNYEYVVRNQQSENT